MKIKMKITVYTIKDCTFSKQEKEYLNTNKLVFEEKDLETNKDFLTEMLAISNNFAGTPVTRVEKDDGTISVLKGFTKEEFDTTFGLASPELKAEAGSTVPAVNDTPIPPVAVTPTETPLKTPAGGDADLTKEVAEPLQSVMDNLKSKAAEPIPAPTQVTEQPVVTPLAADQSASAPAIPNFPAK